MTIRKVRFTSNEKAANFQTHRNPYRPPYSPEVERKMANRERQRRQWQVRQCRGSLRKSRRMWRFLPRHIALEKVGDNNVGGGSGIRTHDTVSRIHAFQACALSHSAIPPGT